MGYRPPRRPQFVAHMGAPFVAPANTVASALAAVEAGADMVEIDVSVTRDRHPVAIHGPRLEHSTDGAGRIRQVTLDAVREVQARLGADVVEGARVPLVEEVLEALGPDVGVNLDLKDTRALQPTLELIVGHGLVDRCVVSGATAWTVGRVRRSGLGVTVLVNLNRFDKLVARTSVGARWLTLRYRRLLRKPDVLALNLNHRWVTAALVQRVHALGAQVWAFTADRPEDVRRLVDLGVDSITTNRIHEVSIEPG